MARARFVLLAASLALGACATHDGAVDDAERVAEAPSAIYGGIVDSGHSYVVGVGNGGISCTGTLISRRTVLTAGHCYGGASKVHFGNKQGQTTTVAVAQKVRHPGYDGNTLAHDLALLKLAADAPVQPAPLLRETMTNTSEFLGPPFTFVGFGYNEQRQYGTKRVVTFPIAAIGPASVGGSVTQIDADQFYYAVPDKNTCNGDSGGPAFAVRQGVERLAGSTSYGDDPCLVDGVDARTDQPAIDDFIQARIDEFEAGSDCKNDGTCQESCNTSGQVWDPDCQAAHCGADGLCAQACVLPRDPDCAAVPGTCGPNGVCDPSCGSPDPDCAALGVDAGVPVPTPDAGPVTPPADASLPGPADAALPPGPADAAPIPLPPDAGLPVDPSDDDGSGDCGCRAGGRPLGSGGRGALLAFFTTLLLVTFAGRAGRRRRPS
jgi:hypothetical protein